MWLFVLLFFIHSSIQKAANIILKVSFIKLDLNYVDLDSRELEILIEIVSTWFKSIFNVAVENNTSSILNHLFHIMIQFKKTRPSFAFQKAKNYTNTLTKFVFQIFFCYLILLNRFEEYFWSVDKLSRKLFLKGFSTFFW